MLRTTDYLLGPSRLTDAMVNEYFTHIDGPTDDDRFFVARLRHWAKVAGVDDANALSQANWESANLTSVRYVRDKNPVGLGIVADGTIQPFVINDYDEAARLTVQAIYSMVTKEWHPRVPIPKQAFAWMSGVWFKKVRDPNYPQDVKQVKDQNIIYSGNRATWAADDAYMGHVDRLNRYIPNIPDQGSTHPEEPPVSTIPTKHSVAKPTIYYLDRDYARFGLTKEQADEIINSCFRNRNGGSPRFIVYHIQAGSTRGSLSYWASRAIDASSTVMIQKDGSILVIVPEQHGPWTNGDVNQPTSQANEILSLGGNPNNWSLTIEKEGQPGDDLSQAELDALIWQTEDWIMKYPAILDSEWCLLRHGFINSVDRAFCGIYMDPVVAAVNDWLGGAGTVPPVMPPVEPPTSIYPPGMSFELARELYGSVKVSWASKPFVFDPTRSECQYWMAQGRLSMTDPADYSSGQWPTLVQVKRRGARKNIHAFQWGNGDVLEKVIRKDP